jgi:hypothetical protein
VLVAHGEGLQTTERGIIRKGEEGEQIEEELPVKG